jgi:para-nitrobenzyl esterase
VSRKEAIVKTKSGKVEGVYQDGLYAFKGIPYAAPPVGELRWQPPRPPASWEGVRDAGEFGTIAPQTPMVGPMIPVAPEPQAEDCLFLNVFTPALDGRRPVMVWIHGGAFTIGSGSDAMYRDTNLTARFDGVLVTINYRLGMLGFLRLKDVTGGAVPATGNEGLLDQIAALEWVRDNIAAFGGDPGNVTVFGESAGAMSIACLMAMPPAHGLFHKAILESGAGGTVLTRDEANATAARFLEVAGINGGDAAALRALTPAQLLAAEDELKQLLTRPGEGVVATVTVPVVDGEVIPDVPNQVARRGQAAAIPVLIGTNRNEWSLFGIMRPDAKDLDRDGMLKVMAMLLPEVDVSGLAAAYEASRRERGESTDPFPVLSAVLSDAMFRQPAIEFIEALRDNGQPAYNYYFTWPSPAMGGILGACHGLEVAFVFGNYAPAFNGGGPEADKLSRCMQEAWTNFARTGDPGGKEIGPWPVYGKERSTMLLDKDCKVAAAPYEAERRAWEKIEMVYYPRP